MSSSPKKVSSSSAPPKAKVRRVTSASYEVASNDEVRIVDEDEGPKGTDRLIQKIKNLLKNPWCSDVVLKNREREFRAHKLILAAWSPVFAAMFQHDMIENEMGTVDISECATEAFKIFLQFLYSGSAEDISCANVVDLYYIADKYQVEGLKADCVEYMKSSLSVDTFCEIMTFSITHDDLELKCAAVQFFCQNIQEIVKTDQWLKYMTENPKHANLLIIKAVNH